MGLTPALFTSAKPDGSDPTKLQPSFWNRLVAIINSLFNGADTHGSLLYRDTSDTTDGASYLPDVAAGSVLVSSGVGAAPAWSAAPLVTSLQIADAGQPNQVLTAAAAGVMSFQTSGGERARLDSSGLFTLGNSGQVRWTSGAPNGTVDTTFARGGAGKVSITGTTPMLQLGGTTSAFPALKRNGAGLEARLADDSGYASLTAFGANLGYVATVATNSSGPRIGGFWLPRLADMSGNVLLDYQDEYAFLDGRGATVSVTPASSSGATSDLFHDDSLSLNWAAGLTGGQVQITIDHSTGAGVVPNRNSGSYQIGLTFRSDFVGPGHIKIEAWTSAAGGSFSSVYDADVTIFGGAFGAWVSPTFTSPDPSFNMLKTRVTLSGLPDPTTGNFRVQRVILYHPTAPWDSFHLGVGGGTLYGALSFAGTAGGDTTLTRSAAGKLALSGTTPTVQIGGTTATFPALKRDTVFVQLRLADDSGVSGAATASLPAAAAARDGIIGFDTTLNALVYYVGGARFKLVGTAF